MEDQEEGLQVTAPTRSDRPTAIVTGTAGLGFEVARALAGAGVDVVLAGRDPYRGPQAADELAKSAPDASVRFLPLDLANLASVGAFSERARCELRAIDILVNNAGVMSPPVRMETADGFELQFGVNHLGHFALTMQLLPLLRLAPDARVVSVTSLAHRYAKMDFDDLQGRAGYNPGVAYCRSKLAQALFAVELDRKSRATGLKLRSMAAHPGFARTNLFKSKERGGRSLSTICSSLFGGVFGQSAADGAQPAVHAALASEAASGALYGPGGLFEMSGAPKRCEFAKTALDSEAASRLWRVSEELSGIAFA